MAETFACIVIGSGPGGYVAAIRTARLGAAQLGVADILSEVDEANEVGIRRHGGGARRGRVADPPLT